MLLPVITERPSSTLPLIAKMPVLLLPLTLALSTETASVPRPFAISIPSLLLLAMLLDMTKTVEPAVAPLVST
jgi:hypothetical protein